MTTPEHADDAFDAVAVRWLERTRSWVLNVLVLDGLSILATAFVLRRWGWSEVDADLNSLKKVFFGSLFVCFIFARILLRGLGSRAKLTDPATRGERYFRSRVATASVGWFALPLGLGYGMTVQPTLEGLAPFWVASMLLGAIALPRRLDLEGFDEPMESGPEPEA